jgi:hypothetical protein
MALSLVAGAGIFGAEHAQARSNAASSGRAINFADQGCFGLWYSSVTNNCGTTRDWEIPLATDTSGAKTVRVTAFGASAANNVGCTAVGVNREVTSVWSSGTVFLPAFGSSQIITLTGASIPAAGTLFAACNVSPSGRVNNVDWNQ